MGNVFVNGNGNVVITGDDSSDVQIINGRIILNGVVQNDIPQLSGVVKVIIEGRVGTIHSDASIECGAVEGRVNAGGSVTVNGPVSGGVSANGSVKVTGNITGQVNAGGSVKVAGNLNGPTVSGGDISMTYKGNYTVGR